MAYCSAEDVKRWLPDAVTTEDAGTPNVLHPSPESITDAEILGYVALADSDINNALSGVYDIPLRKANIGGTVKYPDPVPLISARLTAMLIFQERLSGEQRQDAEWVRDNYDRAMNELQAITLGQRRLATQDSNQASRFAKSGWHNVPPFPSRNIPDRMRG